MIVYNDAKRLPTAVGSVLRQSLTGLEVVIVDDASTDGSAAIATSLARANPARVRAVHLDENSGGCSRPRNVGLDHARGRFVMFLDSDDTLPRHAGRDLVEAAQGAEADFSSGLCLRVHVNEGGRTSPWYRWLYAEPVVYSSVLENPDLLYDTLSTNKCYRREFLVEHGLRFPDGHHYEDLLFTARAYLAAGRIALVPDVVYYWNVVDRTDTPSISNRLHELSNFRDRVEIHRRIDEEFRAAGAEQLKLHKDVKFLRHDILLYLTDLPYRDEAFRRQFLALARDYLNSLDPGAFARAEPVQAVAAYLIRVGDERNLNTAIDYICHGHKLSTRLVARDDRVFWCAEHLDDDEGRRWLDVTGMGFQDLPLGRLPLHNRVTSLRIDGARLRLTGEVVNQLDRVRENADIRLELVLAPRRRRSRGHAVVVPDATFAGDVISWRADVDLTQSVRALGVIDRVWDVRFRLTVDGVATSGRLTADRPEWNALPLPLRPRLGRIAADSAETLVTPNGDLSVQFVPGAPVAAAIHRTGQRAAASPTVRAMRRAGRRVTVAVRHPGHPRVRTELIRRTAPLLPRRPDLWVFESEQGHRCTGNPRAVYDEVLRRRLPVEALWADAGAGGDFPPDAPRVRRGSLAYFAALARAAVWVDDRGLPAEAVKRPGTIYVQTWHGTPVAPVGLDAVPRSGYGLRAAIARASNRWDALVVRSPYDEALLPRALSTRAVLLPVGQPRNDLLLAPAAAAAAADAVRARLGLAADAGVVLWVASCPAAVLQPDASILRSGGRQVLVCRPAHPDIAVPADADVVDASAIDDLSALLCLAEVLVTDHDPVLFDMPLLRRPVVLVGCRCELRKAEPPANYLDLDADAPGPVVWDHAALAALVEDPAALAMDQAESLDRAVKRFGSYEDGQSAAAVVDHILGCRPGEAGVHVGAAG